jgi:hypothetical protein
VHLPAPLLLVPLLVTANNLDPGSGTTRIAADKVEIPTQVNTFATVFHNLLRMIQSSIGHSATPPLASSGGRPL